MARNWSGHLIALCVCGCLKKAHFTQGKQYQKNANRGPCSNCDCKKYKENKKLKIGRAPKGSNEYALTVNNKHDRTG